MNWSPRASKRTKMAPLSSGGSFDEIITNYINKNDVMMFSKSWCPFCAKVKALFAKLNITATILELDQEANGDELQAALLKISGQKTVPNVYIKGKHLGGCDDTLKAHEEGKLVPMIDENPYDYDLIVIGGGSGGLSASKRAASYGKKVAVCDYVKPTPLGTTWGLGGTCVNVGCIPKKLMHQAALLGGAIKDARSFGWATPEETEHRWTEMVESVQNHIGSLNWGYRVALREKNVQYLNQYAEFVDQHTVKLKNRRGKEVTATSNNFLICVGERPKYPDIPGAKEYCITSDDLFSLPSSPGKTLVIGASYVALECAGFLHGIGLDVSVMVRSIYLRGFDQQMAEKVGEYMEKEGIKVLKKFVPLSIELVREKTDDQPQLLRVKSEQTAADGGVELGAGQEEYNTVLLAIGRESVTSSIGLHNVGLKPGRNGKLATDEWDCTSVPNIFCIGDNALGTPELTPVAIQAGKLLADRLYGGSTVKCDYKTVPTTVFTPLEYSCCGYSEEDAIEKFGEQNLEVYHTNAWPLEWTVTGNPLRDSNTCYAKIITNLNDNERIVGIHYLGPNAGEVMQGFAVAMKCGVTKEQLDSTIGIHPTNAEILTTLDVTKRSAGDIQQAGC